MKLAVVGKGGVGKTTVAGVLARTLGRRGLSVIALDCDSNPTLGISLGIGAEATERLAAVRQSLEDGGVEHAPSAPELLERFGTWGPDGVRLAVVTKIDRPDPG
jgi:CO dehydrogenase maturation factor